MIDVNNISIVINVPRSLLAAGPDLAKLVLDSLGKTIQYPTSISIVINVAVSSETAMVNELLERKNG